MVSPQKYVCFLYQSQYSIKPISVTVEDLKIWIIHHLFLSHKYGKHQLQREEKVTLFASTRLISFLW